MKFELFDPEGELRVTAGNLPHWFQPQATYFITFRAEDSIPVEVAELWRRRRDDWLQRHGIDATQPKWKADFSQLPAGQRKEFHTTFSREYFEYLDRGHGSCVLKDPTLASIVADSLVHFDGDRYHIGDFVVMPNHVHFLTCLFGATNLEKQCYSWKKYTAAQINRAIGRRGRFWQEESFDHLVRTPEEFERFRRYIFENPTRAKLRSGEYLYRRCQP
jgi:REP element-mobilizing transposase RayT